MSHIQSTLNRILTEYKNMKSAHHNLKDKIIKNCNELPFNSERGDSIKHPEYKKEIFGDLLGNLNMGWSYGGVFNNWANVPWIRIFNNKNKNPQSGCYLVYLFSIDLKKVYLSLNIGVNEINNKYGYRDACNKISNKSNILRHKLYEHFSVNHNIKEKINLTPKKIHRNLRLPKEYELGNIVAKEYSLESSSKEKKKNEFDLQNDLKYMISLYNNFDKVLQQHKRNLDKGCHNNNSKYNSTHPHNNKSGNNNNYEATLKIINSIKNKDGIYGETKLCKELIHDYQSKKYITIIGKSNIFKDKLKSKFNEIMPKIDDNAGFDYEVIDKKNKEKIYIDAKTNKNNEKSFYMSANEKSKMTNISKKPNEDYLIYMVYNIKNKNKENTEYISFNNYNNKDSKLPRKLVMKLNTPLGILKSNLKFIPIIYEIK